MQDLVQFHPTESSCLHPLFHSHNLKSRILSEASSSVKQEKTDLTYPDHSTACPSTGHHRQTHNLPVLTPHSKPALWMNQVPEDKTAERTLQGTAPALQKAYPQSLSPFSCLSQPAPAFKVPPLSDGLHLP